MFSTIALGFVLVGKVVFAFLEYKYKCSSSTISYKNGRQVKDNSYYYDSKPWIVKVNRWFTILLYCNSLFFMYVFIVLGG